MQSRSKLTSAGLEKDSERSRIVANEDDVDDNHHNDVNDDSGSHGNNGNDDRNNDSHRHDHCVGGAGGPNDDNDDVALGASHEKSHTHANSMDAISGSGSEKPSMQRACERNDAVAAASQVADDE
jgi:hypothetical protein